MKKLLVLLFGVLFTMNGFAQARLDYTGVNEVTQVGDTLVVKYQYFKANTDDAKLYQFDIQYNNKLLTPILVAWQPIAGSEQKAVNSWNGYKFNRDGNKDQTDFDGQYLSWLAGTASYGTDADWSVTRITWQNTTSLQDGDEIVKISYIIKDKGTTNYTNYSNIINVNWVNYQEADGTQIDVTGQSELSLSGIQGGDAGNVTLNVFSNVITNNIGDGSDFGYTIYKASDIVNGINQNTPVEASGNFDASGQATVTGLVNDTEYFVSVYINGQKTYLDEAVTVSDLALIFKEAIGAGTNPNGTSNTWDYAVQKLLGNVVGDMGANAKVDFQDSYEVLAYLQGVTTNNNPRISKTDMAYNVSGVKETFGDKDGNGNPTFSGAITPTDSNKSFNFGHSLIGDVNFSHGFQPTSQLAVASIANKSTSTMSMMANSAKYVPQSANLDLVSELKDGKVVFSINSQVNGMVGSQFNIVYDRTRLRLDDVVFDTGNTMTNFANHTENEGKINIGSFDQNFETNIKVGTPYKLIFTPLVQLNNTAGLINFKVKEGVKTDGSQIKFIMN